MTTFALVIDHPAASQEVKEKTRRRQAEWLAQHSVPVTARSPSRSREEIVDLVLRGSAGIP